jgi:hypothetical protein
LNAQVLNAWMSLLALCSTILEGRLANAAFSGDFVCSKVVTQTMVVTYPHAKQQAAPTTAVLFPGAFGYYCLNELKNG